MRALVRSAPGLGGRAAAPPPAAVLSTLLPGALGAPNASRLPPPAAATAEAGCDAELGGTERGPSWESDEDAAACSCGSISADSQSSSGELTSGYPASQSDGDDTAAERRAAPPPADGVRGVGARGVSHPESGTEGFEPVPGPAADVWKSAAQALHATPRESSGLEHACCSVSMGPSIDDVMSAGASSCLAVAPPEPGVWPCSASPRDAEVRMRELWPGGEGLSA